MTSIKKVLLLVALSVILLLPWHQHAYGTDSIEITSVSTADFTGNPKTTFHPGDNVRYQVGFDVVVAQKTKVISKGTAKGMGIEPGGEEGLFKTTLKKQARRLISGAHTFSWDESIPVNALAGEASYQIKVKLKDGVKDTARGSLTVEEAPSKIAFVRDEIEMIQAEPVVNRDIWIMNPDGSDQERLTSDPAKDVNPAISPDGMRIAFASDRSGNFDIWLLDVETHTPTQLTDNLADDKQPSWSPDGKKIAFSSVRGGSKDLWVMDVDYGGCEQLTFSHYQQKSPQWSPDGKEIAYVSDNDGNDDINKMKSNGRNKQQLTFEIGDQVSPSWSPSTKEIAFAWWELGKPRANIYVMDQNGENTRQLTTKNFYDRGPSWSANGGRISFLTNRAGNFDIWTMNPDGSNMEQVTEAETKESQPDWKKAGFSEEQNLETEITGKGKRNITYIGTVHLAPGGALQVEMSWDDAADLDLGILEPDGTLVRWKSPEGAGRHRGNVTPGPGTEVYSLSGAPSGDYLIGAYFDNFPSTAHWHIRWRDGSFEPTP